MMHCPAYGNWKVFWAVTTAWCENKIASAIGLVIFIDGDERVPAGRKVRQVVAVRGFDLARQDYELLHL